MVNATYDSFHHPLDSALSLLHHFLETTTLIGKDFLTSLSLYHNRKAMLCAIWNCLSRQKGIKSLVLTLNPKISKCFLMSKRWILEPTERYLSGDISHPRGSFEEKVCFFESSVHHCTPMRVEDGISKN